MKIGPRKAQKRPTKSAKTHLASTKPGRGCREAAGGPPAGWPAGLPAWPAACPAGPAAPPCHGPLVPPQAFHHQPGPNPSSRTVFVRVSCSPNFRFTKTLHPTLVVSGNPLPSLAYINPPHSPFKSTPNLLEKFSKESHSLSLELGFKLSNPSSS